MTNDKRLKVHYRKSYLPPPYTIDRMDLDIHLDPGLTRVRSCSHLRRLSAVCSSLVLDGRGLVLTRVEVNGAPWPHYHIDSEGLILDRVPEKFTLTIDTEISPRDNSSLMGLYQSGAIFCTQCEADGFRRITYCLDRPDVLSLFRTRIVANKANYPFLLANGNCIAHGDGEDGSHWALWEDPFPKPCYLFAMVAGDFAVLRDNFATKSGRKVALEFYVDHGKLERTTWAMESLKEAMLWDERRFCLEYDLDVYMVVAVDFFNMGAMENKGLNIFNDKYILADPKTATDSEYRAIRQVIGHEYFHNWTGNRITCRDWFQLTLKEGLTVFREQEFAADMDGTALQRIEAVRLMRRDQFAEDAGPMSHPIRPDSVIEINNFYTYTVYEKGAEVIRMLHTILGENSFQAGMRLYIERHDGKAVTCEDFIEAMEKASGVELNQFRLWYGQSGTPLLTIRDHYDANLRQYCLTVEQINVPTLYQKEKFPLHIPLSVELYSLSGEILPMGAPELSQPVVLNITQREQTFTFDNVLQHPVVSLLGNFSAPVNLDYPYTQKQLGLLMRHARDPFIRWDAGQKLIGQQVLANIESYPKETTHSLPTEAIDAFRSILLEEDLDLAIKAQLLSIPEEDELSELVTPVDPEAIHAIHYSMRSQIAQALRSHWVEAYQRYPMRSYRFEKRAAAERSLRNLALYYWAFAAGPEADSVVSSQAQKADNMTDKLAAIAIAVAAQLPCKQHLLQQFEQHWHHDGLMMDKWFALQAKAPDLNVHHLLQSLMAHQAFSLANPNRTRALIGTFCNRNPAVFHLSDGSGYRLLTDVLRRLNQKNPQLASRLVDPLLRFARYEPRRSSLMRAVLVELHGLENLSRDLFEKIEKALTWPA